MSRRAGTGIVLFCLALAVLACCARAQQKASARYDGHWWLSISPSERSGFLNGYFDCYHYEFKGPAQFTNNPPAIALDLVTKFYEGRPSHLIEPASDVFYRFRDRPGEEYRDDVGEPIKGRHGYYDGLFWRQISAYTGPELEQLGFVEGYLACHAGLNHNKGGVFSKPQEDYVRLITQWYGFNRETDDVDAKREPTAIAGALFRFRDQPQSSQSPRK